MHTDNLLINFFCLFILGFNLIIQRSFLSSRRSFLVIRYKSDLLFNMMVWCVLGSRKRGCVFLIQVRQFRSIWKVAVWMLFLVCVDVWALIYRSLSPFRMYEYRNLRKKVIKLWKGEIKAFLAILSISIYSIQGWRILENLNSHTTRPSHHLII